MANTGKLKFHDETETVRAEAAKLKADGVDIIIVLSHSGLDVDQEIAANCGPDVDVIVGGHTHTFLFTGSNSPGTDTPRGDYPTIITQQSGHKVYVVQASAYTKYLGEITFYFDDQGEILSHQGAPIYLDDSVQPGKVNYINQSSPCVAAQIGNITASIDWIEQTGTAPRINPALHKSVYIVVCHCQRMTNGNTTRCPICQLAFGGCGIMDVLNDV